MSHEDREKWDTRYRTGDHAGLEPSTVVTSVAEYLPERGRALDVAGGAGRHAIWLAKRGLDVTLADISTVGLGVAQGRAREAGVDLACCCLDLETDALPPGPWELVLSVHYLNRDLFPRYAEVLSPGGTLVFLQPTKTNLERHRRPPAPFLLEPGELPSLVVDLEIIHQREGWLEEDLHESLVIARKTP